MIIKLVYNKEIHVYDLKEHESLDYLFIKIRDLFKKLPAQFILIYKNPQDITMQLTTNEELDLLIDSLKNDVKILKLFIEDSAQPSKGQNLSEQKLQRKPSSEFDEMINMTQKFQSINLMDQSQVSAELQNLKRNSSPKEQQVESLKRSSSRSIQSPRVTNENQKFTYIGKPLEMRENQSEREINIEIEQSSDPKQLRNSTTDKQRQILLNRLESERKQIIPENQQEKQIARKPLVYEEVKEEPIANELIEDDFLSHQARCDICNTFPICGPRYKCVVCENYDICQKCEQKHGHDHPVLKISYSFQTPISIKVDIPEYKKCPKVESKIIDRKINLGEMTPKERRERVQSLSSQMAELLNKDLQECMNFVNKYENYTNQTLIQAMIDGKEPLEVQKDQKREKDGTRLGMFKGFIKNIKRYIWSQEQDQQQRK